MKRYNSWNRISENKKKEKRFLELVEYNNKINCLRNELNSIRREMSKKGYLHWDVLMVKWEKGYW